MGVHSFDELRPHVGHDIACVLYKDRLSGVEDNVAIECTDCNEVLVDFDNGDERDCVEWAVWTLTIVHPYGSDFFIFQDATVARKQLYQYVYRNWADEFPKIPCPTDEDQAIEDYF